MSSRQRRRRSWCIFVTVAVVGVTLGLRGTPALASQEIAVPSGAPTIQAAIDAAADGDSVVVDPGTYYENINYHGKRIEVRSSQGRDVTIIDGGGAGPVATFASAEGLGSALRGFTLQHGTPGGESDYAGGGISIRGSSPTIVGNLIKDNTACTAGAGISITSGSPLVQSNAIVHNMKQVCYQLRPGDGGGGISVSGGSPQILDNHILHNQFDIGGGLVLNGTGTSTVRNNLIFGNTARLRGGGISSVDPSDSLFVQNVVMGNSGPEAGGILLRTGVGGRAPLLVGNTVTENTGTASSKTTASGVKMTGSGDSVQLLNNIIAGPGGQWTVICETALSPLFRFNDLYGGGSTPTTGCSGTTANGNISADPGFYAAGDYHLASGSPAIDAGDNRAPGLGGTDIDGDSRIVGALIDQGADEFTDEERAPGLVPTQLSVADGSLFEGDSSTSPTTFTITRSGDTSKSSTVQVRTSGGSATAGADYRAIALTTISFAPGETIKTVSADVAGDTSAEPNETFNLLLSSATGAVLADASATATVVNDDGAAYLSVDDPSVIEASSGTPPTFTVTRSGNVSGTSSLRYQTADGTAAAGADYSGLALNDLVFSPGETTKTVSVNVLDDSTAEANETFSLTLSSASAGAIISDPSGTATIVDDDGSTTVEAPATFLSMNDVWMVEGDSGTSEAAFSVTRSGETSGASSVQVRTSGGTAVAGVDYGTIALTTVSFAPGESTKTVSVDVMGDTLPEANETFNLFLSSASGAKIADPAGTATVVNDDGAAYLAVNDIAVVEGTSGTTAATFTITRSGNTTGSSTVSYNVSSQAATPTTSTTGAPDYYFTKGGSFTFAPGETTKRVTVYVFGDTTVEPSEALNLALSGPTGATASDASGSCTILNDD